MRGKVADAVPNHSLDAVILGRVVLVARVGLQRPPVNQSRRHRTELKGRKVATWPLSPRHESRPGHRQTDAHQAFYSKHHVSVTAR